MQTMSKHAIAALSPYGNSPELRQRAMTCKSQKDFSWIRWRTYRAPSPSNPLMRQLRLPAVKYDLKSNYFEKSEILLSGRGDLVYSCK
mmetsp:Transcript_25703/g.37739  ORF Transcript_25703/g.37739 Transcript_25703/m.37739 type:complete len:88 (+) Transcript_25703:313-576(+)